MSGSVPPHSADLLASPDRLNALARYQLIGSAPEPLFDDVATLAAQLCAASIAFVSFLDDKRQWFKARVGLPVCEMPLDRAMCVHTLPHPGLTVIDDLRQDPRTASAYYVAGPPNLRFYAGVRIDDPAGQPLGTLCVIDIEPRTGGLTATQASSLAALGRQVEAQLALQQATLERDRLARRALQDKVLEFEALAENVSQLAWMADADGSIFWYNRRWIGYTGLSAEAAKGSGWLATHRPERAEKTAADIRMHFASGVAWERVSDLRAADGQYRPFLTRVEPIRDETGRVTRWFGTSTDISAQVAAEERLRELNASLEEKIDAALREQSRVEQQLRQSHKMKAVGQLTGGIAHEFNNILASIGGNLELLELRLTQGRIADLKRYVDIARGGVDRAATLTHRLLAFSRRQTLMPRPVNLNRHIAGIEGMVRHTLGPLLEFEVLVTDETWEALIDPNQLDTALLNLCLNARDAMPTGGRLSIETATVSLDESKAAEHAMSSGDYVTLAVTDTGVGMSADVLSRIFDPFFTTKPLGEGTGLGMSMVYGFVGQSGGQVRIDSAPGRGTRVRIFFPRHEAKTVTPNQRIAAAGPLRELEGRTVLLVEDEEEVRSLVSETLVDLGCTVVLAADGKQGIEIIRSDRHLDLLITDIGLPGGINGYQVADDAAGHRPAMKVLFITGYDQTVLLGQRERKPDTKVLTKPFTLKELVRYTQELINHERLVVH